MATTFEFIDDSFYTAEQIEEKYGNDIDKRRSTKTGRGTFWFGRNTKDEISGYIPGDFDEEKRMGMTKVRVIDHDTGEENETWMLFNPAEISTIKLVK